MWCLVVRTTVGDDDDDFDDDFDDDDEKKTTTSSKSSKSSKSSSSFERRRSNDERHSSYYVVEKDERILEKNPIPKLLSFLSETLNKRLKKKQKREKEGSFFRQREIRYNRHAHTRKRKTLCAWSLL